MFNSARLKLTFWYLLIVMVISVSFSAVIYRVDVAEVERFDRIQRSRIQNMIVIPGFGFLQSPQIGIDPTLVAETERRIIFTLVLINAAILLISGVTGYFLAGITLAPIAEMVEEQNRFISDASHEINTPLTSLKLALEVYLREKKTTLAESKTLVTESLDEVNKLQYLSGSLLQLAQFQKPNNTKFEKVKLADVIHEAIRKVAPMAHEKEIKIEAKLIKIDVMASKYGLTDLLVILLDNAIKYSHSKSKIEISLMKLDSQVSIVIQDYGIGIAKEGLTHIFDRFYRTDEARSKTHKGGYGLGLSIAKKIVDAHHATITVKSNLGKGSTFTVNLPKSS